MYIIKNFNGKTLRGTVTEKTKTHYLVNWEDGAFGMLGLEDENRYYTLWPECKVVTDSNKREFVGTFDECREYCRQKWQCANHFTDFLVRNGYTDVIFLNMIVAQIIAE
jgi:hypothetical protein